MHLDALGTAMLVILAELKTLHQRLLPERDPSDLDDTFFKKSLGRYTSPEELGRQVEEALALETYKSGKPLKKTHKEVMIRVVLLLIACEHFTSALFLQDEGGESESWRHILDAQRLIGFVNGRMTVQTAMHASMKGLNKTHAENRAMKKEVFDWLDGNRMNQGRPNFDMRGERTMDATAEFIASSVVPLKRRSVRDYITEWSRLRSTGRT